MTTIRRATTIAATLGLLLVLGCSAAADPSYTYGQFSLMFSRSAGQYWDAAQDWDGQWAWSPQSNSVSDIAWGDPRSWPPASYEQFELSGNWVLMDGYQSGSTWEPQTVTSDSIGNGNCQSMTALPNTGKEYYVAWIIPGAAYCLDAAGFIDAAGVEVDFTHRQVWSPPVACSNPYYTGRLCITQTEIWSDNNGEPGGPLTVKQDRSQRIALGVGMEFAADDYLHGNWKAYDRYSWGW